MTEINFCPTCGKELQYKEAEICPACGVRIKGTFTSDSDEKYAGFWIRLGAYFVDAVILFIPSMILLFLFVFLVFNYNPSAGQISAYVVGLLISWIYFALQESSSYQATLGKRVSGVIVVNAQSERISLGQATIRWFIKIIPIVNIISYIILAIDDKKQGLHDKVAKTFVIFKGEKKPTVLIIILAIVVMFILLIIFAAIFSYLMLGAGFFATQQSL